MIQECTSVLLNQGYKKTVLVQWHATLLKLEPLKLLKIASNLTHPTWSVWMYCTFAEHLQRSCIKFTWKDTKAHRLAYIFTTSYGRNSINVRLVRKHFIKIWKELPVNHFLSGRKNTALTPTITRTCRLWITLNIELSHFQDKQK